MSKLTISDVTAMARAVGIRIPAYRDHIDEMMRFAELVASKEREACVQVARDISDKYAIGYYGNEVDTADEIAAAIQSRGKK